MDLSIIIVNWNSKGFLANAIASIPASMPEMEYEIVVIDSGSFDGCGEMLEQLHPNVLFIQRDRNVGFGKANNEAFRHSRGKNLLFLNPDTQVFTSAIRQLHRTLQSLPDAGIVGPKLLNGDGTVQETCIRAFPTLLNQLLDSDALRAGFPNSRLWGKRSLSAVDDEPKRVEAVSGACLMIRRSVFESIGGFGDEYFMYAEDMDLCLKAQRGGHAAYYVPRAVVTHFGGASSEQAPANTFSAVMRLESQWRFFRKTRSRQYAALYRAAMFGASVTRIAALLVVWPVQGLVTKRRWATQALLKWLARLRWSIGGERWVRDY